MYQSEFHYAIELHNAGKFIEAFEIYKKLFANDPHNADILNNIGCIYDDMGNIPYAFDYLERARRIDPKNAKVCYNLAWLHNKCKSYELAIKYYTRAIDLKVSTIANAYSNRGFSYEKLKMWNDALEDYSRAIAIEPENIFFRYSRARIYVEKEAYELALEDYRKAVEMRYPEYDSGELVTFIESAHLDKGVDAYKKLACAGFCPGYYGDIKKVVFFFPGVSDRTFLRPENIHVSKTYKRHLRQQEHRYKLLFDSGFKAIMDSVFRHYEKENESLPTTRCILTALNRKTSFLRAVSVALYKDGILVAGDLGIIIEIGDRKIYISITGYHDESCAGTVHLILIARYLAENGFALWDFGPSTNRWDPYKLRLGCEKMTTEAYLSLFSSICPESKNIFTKSVKSGKSLINLLHIDK